MSCPERPWFESWQKTSVFRLYCGYTSFSQLLTSPAYPKLNTYFLLYPSPLPLVSYVLLLICTPRKEINSLPRLVPKWEHAYSLLFKVYTYVFFVYSGGLSNLLYFCQLPTGVKPVGEEPPCALLRIYGPTHDGENVLEAHFSECVVFTMLSEKESGPRLYGIFPGGRLEQYIPVGALTACHRDRTLTFSLSKNIKPTQFPLKRGT